MLLSNSIERQGRSQRKTGKQCLHHESPFAPPRQFSKLSKFWRSVSENAKVLSQMIIFTSIAFTFSHLFHVLISIHIVF